MIIISVTVHVQENIPYSSNKKASVEFMHHLVSLHRGGGGAKSDVSGEVKYWVVSTRLRRHFRAGCCSLSTIRTFSSLVDTNMFSRFGDKVEVWYQNNCQISFQMKQCKNYLNPASFVWPIYLSYGVIRKHTNRKYYPKCLKNWSHTKKWPSRKLIMKKWS